MWNRLTAKVPFGDRSAPVARSLHSSRLRMTALAIHSDMIGVDCNPAVVSAARRAAKARRCRPASIHPERGEIEIEYRLLLDSAVAVLFADRTDLSHDLDVEAV